MSVSDYTQILDSAVIVADGVSADFPIPTWTMGALGVEVKAASGTTPAIDLWLQISPDNKTTWVDMPADLVEEEASETVTANKRNVLDGVSAVKKALGVYKHLVGTHARLKWAVTGTTPSFTVAAALAGK